MDNTNPQASASEQIYRPNKYIFYLFLGVGILLSWLIVGIPIIIAALLWYKFSYITLGPQGVELRKGWLNVVRKQVPYTKINTVEVTLTIADRFLKSGTIRIFTGNDIQGIAFYGIDSPHEIKRLIEERAHTSTTPNAAQPSGAAEEIVKFADLRDKGIITEEEFEAKKKQLLS